jgi:hypothetical protein
MASRLQSLMKSRRSTSAISVFLGFVLTDVTVYPAAVPLFNRAVSEELEESPTDSSAGRFRGSGRWGPIFSRCSLRVRSFSAPLRRFWHLGRCFLLDLIRVVTIFDGCFIHTLVSCSVYTGCGCFLFQPRLSLSKMSRGKSYECRDDSQLSGIIDIRFPSPSQSRL